VTKADWKDSATRLMQIAEQYDRLGASPDGREPTTSATARRVAALCSTMSRQPRASAERELGAS